MTDFIAELEKLGVSNLAFNDTKTELTICNGESNTTCKFNKNKLAESFEQLELQMNTDKCFGDEKIVRQIVKLIVDMYAESAAEQRKAEEGKGKVKKYKEEYSQVYRSNRVLGEAVLIDGEPYWLVCSNPSSGSEVQNQIHIQDSIDVSDRKAILPLEAVAYTNRPYSFSSKEELDGIIDRARKETLDTLYLKVKKLWNLYIAEGDNHISICAADTIFTLFQDKIGLTHYLFFIADNDTGKTNNLYVLNFLAYRNMLSMDMTPANIYSYLGSKYEGLGTICEDEADDIDESREKMKIYKSGYTTGVKVYRTDTNTSEGRKQDAFYTFCFKSYAAEKLPDSFKAKGFIQRIVQLSCTPGMPQYDISEVVNPSGDDIDEELLAQLNDTRNLLLVYRVLHYWDKIPNIKLNISNREKQLFKPVLRVFQNTETFTKLLPVISNFVNQRREEKSSTITAFLYRLVSDLIRLNDNDPKLESSAIWFAFQDQEDNPGELKSKYTYDSVAFGEISQKTLVQMLKDQFNATRPKHTGSTKQLIFDVAKLKAIGNKYKSEVDVKVLESDESDESGYGLDRHLTKDIDNKEIVNNNDKTQNNYNEPKQISKDSSLDTSAKPSLHSNNATQATQATQPDSIPTLSELPPLHNDLRWSDKTALWYCGACGLSGDKSEMEYGVCSQKKRKGKK